MTGRRIEGRPNPRLVPARLRTHWYRLFRLDDQRALGGFVGSLAAVPIGAILWIIHPRWQAAAMIGLGLILAGAFLILPSALDALLDAPTRLFRRPRRRVRKGE